MITVSHRKNAKAAFFIPICAAESGIIMNKKDVDNIVEGLLEEKGGELSKQEIARRFAGEYSHGQRERIYYRYRYLLYSDNNNIKGLNNAASVR